jgi:hypothetical protein
MDTNPNTSIGQNVHKSGVPRFPSFDLSLLYSVGLQKFVQPLLRAPSTFVRVRIYLDLSRLWWYCILPDTSIRQDLRSSQFSP